MQGLNRDPRVPGRTLRTYRLSDMEQGNRRAMSPNRSYLFSLLIIAVFFTLLLLLKSVNEPFNVDEFEHIHSAWYVKTGRVPYSDFFQHHNPLLWYLMVPVLWVFGQTVESVIAFRLMIFVFTIGIAFLTYLISRTLTDSREAGLFSVVLLFTMTMFVASTVEIRPDVPMVLFGLVSIYYLVRYFQTNMDRHIMLSGLFASISFLFLQKTLFLLFAYAAVFAYHLFTKRISIKSVIRFCVCFVLPQLVFAGHLLARGSFRDYVLTNWILNIARSNSRVFSPLSAMDFTRYLPVFWGLSALAIVLIFWDKKTSVELKVTAFIPVVLLLCLYLVRRPWNHYFMPFICVLCIVLGCFLKLGFDNLKLPALPRILLLVLIIYMPAKYLTRKIRLVRNDSQLEKVDFVLANSDDSDLVYDGYNRFNLYRRDLHYFWYSVGELGCLHTYNRITKGKYDDYDVCKLIRAKRPKFISDYELDIAECGLDELYERTKYTGLYIRKPGE